MEALGTIVHVAVGLLALLVGAWIVVMVAWTRSMERRYKSWIAEVPACTARAAARQRGEVLAVRGKVVCAEPIVALATKAPGAIAITQVKYSRPSGKPADAHATRTAAFEIDDGTGRVRVEVEGSFNERGGPGWRIYWRAPALDERVELRRGDALTDAILGGSGPERSTRARLREWVLRGGDDVTVCGRVDPNADAVRMSALDDEHPLAILVESGPSPSKSRARRPSKLAASG